MKIKPYALSGLLLPISIAALADDTAPAAHIESTIVTATRTEQAIADSLAPVTIFEREDIQRIQPTTLQELLERSVGATFVRNGGRGSATSLLLRGNQSNHVLVLVDGVRIGSATLGSPSLTNLPPELIERVEIVRGPRSSLYGSEAIGGVVNIITRKYHDTQGIKPLLQLTAGTQDSLKAVAALSGGTASTQGNITVLRESTDGVDNTESKTGFHGDKDRFEQDAVNVSLSHNFNATNSLSALYQKSASESDYDADCYDASYTAYDCAPYSEGEVTVANLRGDFQPLSFWRLSISAGESVDDSEIATRRLDPAASGISTDDFKTTRRIFTLQNDLTVAKGHVLTLGAEKLKDEVDSNLAYNEDDRDNDAFFLQWQGELGAVSWVTGYRKDDNSQFGVHETANVSVGINLTSTLKLVTSYGEGFNAPTFNDLYYPYYGVATLEPETSENYEVALRGTQPWGNWGISYYENNVDKLIQYNPATYGPDQIDAAKIKGAELELTTRLGQWNLTTNATILDATDDQTGKTLRRRPDHQLNLDLSRDWTQWGVYASWRLVDSRYEDAAETDELGGYGIVDGGVSYQHNAKLRVQLAVKNALDKDYVSARSYSLGDYQSIGREVMLTLTYTP